MSEPNLDQALKDQKKALEADKQQALTAQKQVLDEEKAQALTAQKQAGFDFGSAGSAEPEKPRTSKSGKWRATKGCTWQGKFVKEGTIVAADEMDNPHFEEVPEAKREPR
jgi:hypothetical protein